MPRLCLLLLLSLCLFSFCMADNNFAIVQHDLGFCAVTFTGLLTTQPGLDPAIYLGTWFFTAEGPSGGFNKVKIETSSDNINYVCHITNVNTAEVFLTGAPPATALTWGVGSNNHHQLGPIICSVGVPSTGGTCQGHSGEITINPNGDFLLRCACNHERPGVTEAPPQ